MAREIRRNEMYWKQLFDERPPGTSCMQWVEAIEKDEGLLPA